MFILKVLKYIPCRNNLYVADRMFANEAVRNFVMKPLIVILKSVKEGKGVPIEYADSKWPSDMTDKRIKCGKEALLSDTLPLLNKYLGKVRKSNEPFTFRKFLEKKTVIGFLKAECTDRKVVLERGAKKADMVEKILLHAQRLANNQPDDIPGKYTCESPYPEDFTADQSACY